VLLSRAVMLTVSPARESFRAWRVKGRRFGEYAFLEDSRYTSPVLFSKEMNYDSFATPSLARLD
jgi:hypothetical protein